MNTNYKATPGSRGSLRAGYCDDRRCSLRVRSARSVVNASKACSSSAAASAARRRATRIAVGFPAPAIASSWAAATEFATMARSDRSFADSSPLNLISRYCLMWPATRRSFRLAIAPQPWRPTSIGRPVALGTGVPTQPAKPRRAGRR